MTTKKLKALAFREGRKELGLPYDKAVKYALWKLRRESTWGMTAYDFLPEGAVCIYRWEEYCYTCLCKYMRYTYILPNGRYVEVDDHLLYDLYVYPKGQTPRRY